jgi:hypothetical protein
MLIQREREECAKAKTVAAINAQERTVVTGREKRLEIEVKGKIVLVLN